jgi:hypothetical protein
LFLCVDLFSWLISNICSISGLRDKDAQLERDFETFAFQRFELERQMHGNTASLEMLANGLIKARKTLEELTTNQLVGSPEKFLELVLLITTWLPEKAGLRLLNRHGLMEEFAKREKISNAINFDEVPVQQDRLCANCKPPKRTASVWYA